LREPKTVINVGQGSYCTSTEEICLQVYKSCNIVRNNQLFQNLHFCKSSPTTLPVLNCDVASYHNTFLEKITVAVTL